MNAHKILEQISRISGALSDIEPALHHLPDATPEEKRATVKAWQALHEMVRASDMIALEAGGVTEAPNTPEAGLRDIFATAVMQALVTRYGMSGGAGSISSAAYELADAMMKEREK